MQEEHVAHTGDGMLVTGKDFFEGFQWEEETGNGV